MKRALPTETEDQLLALARWMIQNNTDKWWSHIYDVRGEIRSTNWGRPVPYTIRLREKETVRA